MPLKMGLRHQQYICVSVFLVCGYLSGWIIARPEPAASHQQPIGAYRVYQKTHFQCAGRPSGYYADVETGCQVYHMCDGLGRQFSYSCPNTTLFQQRMLICDHWYMVNCSRAESNYDANLLIGQRDKPFVTDQENELRTPRPDLLDRPYAADYAGESYRNQYNFNPTNLNSLDVVEEQSKLNTNRINDDTADTFVQPNHPYTFATHWSTQHPSRAHASTVNPHQQTSSSLNDDLEPPFLIQSHDALLNGDSQDLEHSSSQDSRRSEPETNFINSGGVHSSSSAKSNTDRFEKPSFNNPYRPLKHNIAAQPITQQQLPSTAAFTSFTQQQQSVTSPTTITDTESISTTNADSFQTTDRTPQPFAPTNKLNAFKAISVNNSNRGHTKFSNSQQQQLTNNEALFSNAPSAVVTPPNHDVRSSAVVPQINLLPPFDKLHIYDDATTQGPPIYSQWKIPSSGLLPPLLHSKLISHQHRQPSTAGNDLLSSAAAVQAHHKSHKSGVPAHSVPISALKRPANGLQPPRFDDARTETTTKTPPKNAKPVNHNNYNDYRKSNLVQTTPSFPLSVSDLFTTTAPTPSNLIPADSPVFALHNPHPKSPTPRSISPNNNKVNGLQSSSSSSSSSSSGGSTNSKHIGDATPPQHDKHYLELKKLLHIPDYTFPLEADSRTRGLYVRDDSVTSFQVKIPAGIIDINGGAATTDSDIAAAATSTSVTSSGGGGVDLDDASTTIQTTRRSPWYGENAACPECHPAFVQAGSCEPCVKFRR